MSGTVDVPRLCVSLLGRIKVSSGSRLVPFVHSGKLAALFAYVLLHRTEIISRESLAFLLWPDDREVDARANLRRHLYRLTHALPAGRVPWIEADAVSLRWNEAAPFLLDVDEFERLSASESGLREATGLYGGELAAGCYEDCIFAERERLHNLNLSNLTKLIRESRRDRDFPAAISFIQMMLQADPWREDALRQLMMARFEAGDRAGALADYKSFGQRMREELGADLMPETVATYQAVMRSEASLTGDSPPIGQTAGPRSCSFELPFVGRRHALDRLVRCWQRSARGQGTTALIGGEAGIGKSRLAAELMSVAESQGARTARGHTAAIESRPYEAILEALRFLEPVIASVEIEPVWLGALSVLLPSLRLRYPRLAPAPALDPAHERSRIFEAIAIVLEALARTRPMVLLLEDVHWAGSGTLELIDFLARRATNSSLLVVLTFREEEIVRGRHARQALRRLQRDDAATLIALRRLSLLDVGEVIRATCSGLDRNGDLADRLFAHSEGNPLILSQAIRHCVETGDTGNVRNATTVNDTIEARLKGLSERARTLAECAATVGSSFDLDLMRAVCGWSEGDLLDGIDELLECQLVREMSTHHRADYAFVHHVVRDAIYNTIDAALLQRRHRRIARALPKLYPEQVDDLGGLIGMHCERAGLRDEAADAYLRAARRMHQTFANEEARDFAVRAIELASDDRRRFAILLLRAEVEARRGDREAQTLAVSALVTIANAIDDPVCQSEAYVQEARLFAALGQRELEEAAVARLERAAAATGSPRWRADASRARGDHCLAIGDLSTAASRFLQALELYGECGMKSDVVAVLCAQARSHIAQGSVREADALIALARDHAGGDDAVLLTSTLKAAASAAVTTFDFPRARAVGDELLSLCGRIGDREGEADAHAWLGAAVGLLANVVAAQGHYAEAIRLYRSLQNRQGEAAVSLNSAMLRHAIGDNSSALQTIDRAQTLFVAVGDLRGQTICILNRARVLGELGDYDGGAACAERAEHFAHRLGSAGYRAHALGTLAYMERKRGRLERSIELRLASVDAHRALEQRAPLLDGLCELAFSYVEQGAVGAAQHILSELDASDHAAVGDILAQSIPWSLAQLHRAIGEPARCAEYLATAHRLYLERFDAIGDPTACEFYQKRDPNDALREAVALDRWPSLKGS